MKLTNGQIHNYFTGYHNFDDKDIEIPFVTMYKVRKNIQKLEEADVPIQQTIQDIVKKYGTDTKNPDLNKALIDISKIENDVEIDQIPVSEFGDVKVPPKFMDAIFFMLKD